MTTQPCTHEDLRAEVIATAFVTDNGDPITEIESYDLVKVELYFCGPCGQDFDTWQDALDHLPTNNNPSHEAQKEAL
jgi:hypothetical protein